MTSAAALGVNPNPDRGTVQGCSSELAALFKPVVFSEWFPVFIVQSTLYMPYFPGIGLSHLLGTEYERKKQKLQRELQLDYRNYISRV